MAQCLLFRISDQVCVSPTRFFVQENAYGKFVQKFTGFTQALAVGNGIEAGSKSASRRAKRLWRQVAASDLRRPPGMGLLSEEAKIAKWLGCAYLPAQPFLWR